MYTFTQMTYRRLRHDVIVTIDIWNIHYLYASMPHCCHLHEGNVSFWLAHNETLGQIDSDLRAGFLSSRKHRFHGVRE